MALVRPQANATTPNTTAPAVAAFEPMDDDTTTVNTAAPAANQAAPAPAANDAPAAAPVSAPAAPEAAAPTPPSPERAVTPAANSALATSTRGEASKFQQEVEAMKGAADFSYGNYSVFKGQNGEIAQTGGTKLGRWVKVSMIAWDDHWEISPGSDTDKSKEAVGYSKEGVTVDSIIGEQFRSWVGKPCADYVKFLQEEHDYTKAKVGRFIDVACVVHGAESEDSLNGEIIQVTLSQSSIPSFSQYQERLVQKARAISRGVPGVTIPDDPFTFYFLREAAEKNGKSWTKLKVVDKLPPKL